MITKQQFWELVKKLKQKLNTYQGLHYLTYWGGNSIIYPFALIVAFSIIGSIGILAALFAGLISVMVSFLVSIFWELVLPKPDPNDVRDSTYGAIASLPFLWLMHYIIYLYCSYHHIVIINL